VCCLAELHHMITIFGGIGRLRVRTSFLSQIVRIDFYYTARSHFSVVNSTFPSLDCITAFEIALEIALICESCIDAYLIVLSLLVLSCWTWSHDNNIWRNRTSRPSFVSQMVRIHLLYSTVTLFCGDCEFGQPWLYYSIRNRTWNIIDLWRLYRCSLNCAIASCAVLLNLITCHEYLAVSDICSYAYLMSFSLYVLMYYTSWMRVSLTLIVLQHSKSHLKYYGFVKAASMLTCAIASRAVLLDPITYHGYSAVSTICAYASDDFQWVRIDLLQPAHTFLWSVRVCPALIVLQHSVIAYEIWLICEGCILSIALKLLSHAVLWDLLHATNIRRYRTSARTRRMSFRPYVLIFNIQPAHTCM